MDPTLELQGVIIARLREFAMVTDLVGQRSYDEPPAAQNGTVSTAMPYISLGPSNYQTEEIDCIDGGEIMIQIDVWSNEPGQVEMRKIAHAVRGAFRGYDFTLTENALVTFTHWRTDLIDGAIKHASVRFTAIVEEPSS